MKTSIRRVIFAFFILMFLTTSVMVLSYASGYRFSSEHRAIVQTGILFVSGRPRSTDVYINGTDEKKRLPYRATHLIPGPYTIRLEKEGYYTWQKTLSIWPRETTFATDLTLFRSATPFPVIQIPLLQAIRFFGDQLLLITAQGENVSLAFAQTPENPWTINLGASVENVSFLSTMDQAFTALRIRLTDAPDRTLIYYPQRPERSFLLPLYRRDAIQQPLINAPSGDILVQSGNFVLAFDIDDKSYTLVTTGVAMGTTGEQLWLWTQGEKGMGIYTHHLLTKQKTYLTGTPLDVELEPLDIRNNAALLWDSFSGRVYHGSENAESLIAQTPIQSDVRPTILWNEDRGIWLLNTSSEIWFVNPNSQATLLERSSQEVKGTAFLGDRPYILTHIGDEVRILELDDRDGRQSWKLETPTEAVRVVVNTDSTQVAFVEGEDIFTLPIR